MSDLSAGCKLNSLKKKGEIFFFFLRVATNMTSLRFLLLLGAFSLLCFSDGKCLVTSDWKTPLKETKKEANGGINGLDPETRRRSSLSRTVRW